MAVSALLRKILCFRSERLFPPMDVPYHQLSGEDFGIADAVGGFR
jgi:hypothetical protein